MELKKKVAVVILNYNGKNWLEKFLPNVIQYSEAIADIIIADNKSTDDSLTFLSENYSDLKTIINDQNGGFAKGYNDALSHLDYEYFLLLNSDIELVENWLEPLVSFLDQNPDYAACQPKVRAYNDKTKFEHAGASGGFIDHWGYPFCRGRMFMATEHDKGQYDDIKEIFWATGACFLIRADLFKSFGGFDERFFAHMEEIDLCWRLKNKGHRIACIPESIVYHVGGGTLDYQNPKKTYLNFRNSLYMILKNEYDKFIVSFLFFRMILDGVAGLKFLLEGKLNHFFSVMKAHFAFYKSLPILLKQRKALKKNYKPNYIGTYKGSIVTDFFIKKKHRFSELDSNKFVE